MGIKWNYFKSYKIEDDYPDDVIKYIGGKYIKLGYSTSGILGLILAFCGASMPIYCWLEPPKSKKLELLEPGIVIDACNKSIELLSKENNPQIDDNGGNYKPLFDEDDLEHKSIEEANKGIVRWLKEVKKLSEKGYYITQERD